MTVHRIVIGTDGSDGARKALGWTASLAAQLGAEVVAIYAYSPLDALAEGHGTDLATLAELAEARLRDDWCAPLTEAGVSFRSHLVEDLPVDALVTTATEESADLIVIGSHGRTGWRERILGSTASGLPHHTRCPVVIVPQDKPA